MSNSPLTKVASPAFSNGSALSTKKFSIKSAMSQLSPQALDLQQSLDKFKQVKQQQLAQPNLNIQDPQNNKDHTSNKQQIDRPTEETEQSPSKFINIYSYDQQHRLFQDIDLVATYSTIQNGQHQESNQKTYNKMSNEEAEQLYGERQRVIKDQIQRTKNGKKQINHQKKPVVLKGVLKKSQNMDKSINSQQIDLSRTSLNQRRKSIEQPLKTIPTPYEQDTLHTQLLRKKRLLLEDIEKLDKEIKTIQKQVPKLYPETSRQRGPVLYHQGLMQEDRKHLKQKIAEREKISREMEECTFKPQISATSRKLNSSTQREFRPKASVNQSKITPQTSPKQGKGNQRKPRQMPRSYSQDEIQKSEENILSKEQLNERLNSMNQKYQSILEQANKIKSRLS